MCTVYLKVFHLIGLMCVPFMWWYQCDNFISLLFFVFGWLLKRNWIPKRLPKLPETPFGKICLLLKWPEMCSVFCPWPPQWAESTELLKNGYCATIWAAGVEKLSSAGEFGEAGSGVRKLYILIRCWHCLWLWIVTGGCIYGAWGLQASLCKSYSLIAA